MEHEELLCPNCKKSNYVKDGFDRNREQYYKCKECNKKFSGINTSQANNQYRLKGYSYPLPIILYCMRLYVCFTMNPLEVARILQDRMEYGNIKNTHLAHYFKSRPSPQQIKSWYNKLILTKKLKLFESNKEAELFLFKPKRYEIKKIVYDKNRYFYCLFNTDYEISSRNVVEIAWFHNLKITKEYFQFIIMFNETNAVNKKYNYMISEGKSRRRFIPKKTGQNLQIIRNIKDKNNRKEWSDAFLELEMRPYY